MLKYQYALANVWWNKSAQDQPLFATPETLDAYFESVRTPWSELFNFQITNSMTANIMVRSTLPTNEVLDYHYLIIREMDDAGAVVKTYHYFAEISQDSGAQYLCILERDVIIDYYNLGIIRNRPYSYIKRTHLDRFVNENNSLKFNGGLDSPLYIAEDIETDTPVCNSLQVVNLYYNKTDFDKWLYTRRLEWVYVYLSANEQFEGVPYYHENDIAQGYMVLVFPNLGSDVVPVLNGKPWSLNQFIIDYPKLTPYILTIRVSCTSPVDTLTNNIYLSITNISGIPGVTNVTFTFNETNLNNDGIGSIRQDGNKSSYFVLYHTPSKIGHLEFTDKLSNLNDFIYQYSQLNKNKVIGPKVWYKEPKLFNGIIKMMLSSGPNKGIEYNLLSLLYVANDQTTIEINESLVAGITRYYLGLSSEYSLYNFANYLTFSQNSISQDTTIPFSVNQYETFLANNKNFYQQASLDINARETQQVTMGIVNMAQNTLNADLVGFIGNTFQTGFAVDNAQIARKQTDYKMDNLRYAPPDVKNINGNYMLIMNLTTLNPRFEVWQPAQSNLEKIADYLFFNGYNFNKLGRLADYDSTRKYFNYIECDINGIKYDMNDIAYARLRDKLLAGVRLWHVNPGDVNFDETDNYEVWVDNLE